jgi:diguanylate cyclase (GGDEF)-like protein
MDMGEEQNIQNGDEPFYASAESLRPLCDFSEASQLALGYIRKLTGFQLCAVARIEQHEFRFLHVNEDGIGVKSGDTFDIDESVCPMVVSGRIANFVPDMSKVHPSVLVGSSRKIGAHIGVPILLDQQRLFGTICCINSTPVPELLSFQAESVSLIAQMLSTILMLELRSVDQIRSYERVKMESERDELTNLLNRRGWDRSILQEDSLIAQYGFSASIVVIDIDNLKTVNDSKGHQAGDEIIRKAARVIGQTSRSDDVVARTGGDEFAVLTKCVSPEGTDAFVRRLKIALTVAGVQASVGICSSASATSLSEAWDKADQNMYLSKRSKS